MKAIQKINSNPLEEDLDHILARTKGLWDELRDKRIFITGGTGFFGCWFLESFARANEKLKLNASMFVLTRNIKAFRKKAPHLLNNPSIHFLLGDVRSFDFPKGKFDYIIHAAASLSPPHDEKESRDAFDVIVEGTRRVLEFAEKRKVKKLLLISSGAVYGRQDSRVSHLAED